MAGEIKKEIELEIAYVLFIDIVGYSKLLINDQRRLIELLNEIVRGTEQFKKAEANHRLITIPDRRRHGAGFLQYARSAGGMRTGG